MLWNWYTINACFLAGSWYVKTRGQFAGSCISCFLLVMSAQWLHRLAREYDSAIVRRKQLNIKETKSNDSSLLDFDIDDQLATLFSNNDTLQPIFYALSHNWY